MKESQDQEMHVRAYLATAYQWAERLRRIQTSTAEGTEEHVAHEGWAIEARSVEVSESSLRVSGVSVIWRAVPLSMLLALVLCGCSGPRALRGGRAVAAPSPSGGIEQTIAQGENPSVPSRQDQETIKVRTYTLPAGSRIEQRPAPVEGRNGTDGTDGTGWKEWGGRSTVRYQLSAPLTITEREESRAGSELGAAQKDTARELTAKLSSLKGIVWAGIALFVFGLASLFWAPLRTLIGSVTTSAAVTLGGLALMVLPSLIVGNEVLILGGVVGVVGVWFLARRHGELRGAVGALGSGGVAGGGGAIANSQ